MVKIQLQGTILSCFMKGALKFAFMKQIPLFVEWFLFVCFCFSPVNAAIPQCK